MRHIDITDSRGHRHTVPLCNLPTLVAEDIEARKAEILAEKERKAAQEEQQRQIAAAQQQFSQAQAAAIFNPPVDLAVPVSFDEEP